MKKRREPYMRAKPWYGYGGEDLFFWGLVALAYAGTIVGGIWLGAWLAMRFVI